MSAELLAIDPVAAAQRLLGGVLTGRGTSAVIVEVEAYGGPPDGQDRYDQRERPWLGM